MITVEAETGTAGNLTNSNDTSTTMRFPSKDPEVGPTDGNLEDNNGHVDNYNGRAGKAVATITLPELSFGGEGGVRTHSKPSKRNSTSENLSSCHAPSYSNYLGDWNGMHDTEKL